MTFRRLCLSLLLLTLASTPAFSVISNNPVPFIDQPLTPGSAIPGSSGFSLTVNGTGFVAASVVQWNGTALTTTFVSSSKLTAIVPSANIATATTASITVFSPAPGGGTSNVIFLPVSRQTTTVAYTNFATYSSGGPATLTPGQYVTADFNGDGKLDLATLNGDGSVSVLLGNGDGTFQPPAILNPSLAAILNLTGTVSVTTLGIATGDFNGDGKLDIAVYNGASGSSSGSGSALSVFPGFGDGTFGTPISTTSSASTGTIFTFLVAADFNADGILDLLAPTGTAGALQVWTGNGDGTFTAASSPINAPSGINNGARPAVGDFNGDGKLDVGLAYGTSAGNQVLAVALGNGDGTFGVPTAIETLPGFLGDTHVQVAAADFDENGILDLAFFYENCVTPLGPCSGTIDMLSGVGDGTFLPPLTASNLDFNPTALLVADLNEDNHSDLLVGSTPLLGRGDGTFIINSVTVPNEGGAVGDFNGDGLLDVISPSTSTFTVDLRTPPDFTGNESPTSVTVVAGANTSYQVYIAPLYGSESDVTLAVSGVPSGATSFFTPSGTIAQGNGATQLQINTTSSTTPGTYMLTLTGVATNGATHSSTLTLVVNPATADWVGDITPSSTLIAATQTANYIISGQPINGFTGDVTLSVTGYPPGSLVTFNPPVVPGANGSSMLSITPPANAANGTYILTITGTSGSLSHSGQRVLQVNNTADFGGYLSPWTQAVVAGQRVGYTVNLTSVNGYTGGTALSVSGLPTGATYRITPSTIVGGSGTASLLIQTSASTPIGVYMPTITAQSGSDIKSHPFELDVNPAGDFSGSISTDQTVAAGSTATYAVNIIPVSGFNANVTLAVSAASGSQLPPGSTVSFSPSNVVSGGSGTVNVTITTLPGTPLGTYTLLFSGTSGGLFHSGTKQLVVTSQGDFGGTVSDSQTVMAGSSAVFMISLAATGGFTSNVTVTVTNLAGSQLPPNSTITFSPSNVISGGTGTVMLTIATSSSTPIGTYSIAISGTGGGITHSVGRTVTVIVPGS